MRSAPIPGGVAYAGDGILTGLVPGANTIMVGECFSILFDPPTCTAADTVVVTYLADSIASGPVKPLVELAQPGAFRTLDANPASASRTWTYALPPEFIMGGARTASLSYSSELAKPVGTVALDVAVPTTAPPQALSVRVKLGGSYRTLTSGGTWATVIGDTGRVRLAAQFATDDLPLGAWPVDVEVHAYWSGTGYRSDTVATRVLTDHSQAAPYGVGWRVDGVARLTEVTDGVAIASGAGTVGFYRLVTCVPASGGIPEHCEFANPRGTDGTLWMIATDTTDHTRWMFTAPDGTVQRFNTAGLLTKVTDRWGNGTRIAYDTAWGYLPRVKELRATVRPPSGPPHERVITFAYNGGTGRLASITLPDGRQATFTADGNGDLVSVVDPDGVTAFTGTYVDHQLIRAAGRSGAADTVLFNAFGQVTEARTPPVATETEGTVRAVTTIQSLRSRVLTGQSSSATAGTVPAMPVDSAFTRMTAPGAVVVTTWPDRSGGVARTILVAPGTNAKIATTLYDTLARPVVAIDPNGGRSMTQWDDLRVRRTTAMGLYRAAVTEYRYARYAQVDSVFLNGGLLATSRFSGDSLAPDSTWHVSSGTRAFAYDGAGRVHRTWHEWFPHRRDSVTYDSLTGNARVMWRMLDTVVYARDSVTFDAVGRVASTTDATGRTVTHLYDRLNRDTMTVGPLGATSKWAYADAIGRATFTDAMGQVYVDSANALGWVVLRRDPRGNRDTFGYDRLGNVVRQTTRTGDTLRFAYDSLNRVVRRIAKGAAGTDTATYGYAANDQFTWAKNAWGLDSVFPPTAAQTASRWSTVRNGIRFEGERRTTAVGQPDTLFVRRTTAGLPGQAWADTAAWAWNAAYTLQSIRDFGSATSTVAYSMAGLPSALQNPGHTQTFSYDSLGRLAGVQVGTSGSTLSNQFSRTRGFDGLDRVTQEQRVGLSRSVTYDSLGYVAGVTETDTSFAFVYDSVGNRRDGSATLQTGNRLVQFAGITMQYDSAGRVVRRARAGVDTLRFTWDAVGQLAKVVRWRSGAGTDSVTYRYDGWGRRILRDEGGIHGAQPFLYDGAQVVMDLSSIYMPAHAYTYLPGIDAPHSVLRYPADTAYYVRDLAGNVAGFARKDGAYYGRYRYAPYGETLVDSAYIAQPLRWQAREWDDKAGLYYFRARYYDPVLGRFISEDPIGLAGGENPYLFAMSDPLNGRDPTGLQGQACNPTSGGVLTGVGQCPGVTITGQRRPSTPVWPFDQGPSGERCLDEMGYDWPGRCWSMPRDGMGTNSGYVEPDPGPPLASRRDACSLPPILPPGASYLQNIEMAASLRSAINRQYAAFSGAAGTASLPTRMMAFYPLVRNGGPWDYKQQGRQYLAAGNFNFGATGAALGIPDQILFRGAGWAQQRAGTSSPSFGSPFGGYPFGDDPEDQFQIRRGITYYNQCAGGR